MPAGHEREIKKIRRAQVRGEKNLNIYGRCRKISTRRAAYAPRGEFYGRSAREPRERVFDLLFYLGRARLLLKFGRVIIFALAPLLFAPSTTP
jgi:hypothetical protein